ncbi:MAG TPA: hypothetical protein VK395_02105 [Gemmataceae bacterium]|nr:hypothetical protein [Gemmataceae bacterium]
MCNPRRVKIHLRRTVKEAWRSTVEQAATASGEVREQARVTLDIPLATALGELPLQMLERLLRGDFENFDGWERDAQGNYRQALGEVTIVYEPGSRQLIAEATLVEQITEAARAAAEARGSTEGEVEAEGVGRYYSDNWGGRTEEHARQDAQAEAERRLAAAAENLHRQAHQAELAAAEQEARAQAQRLAEAQLEDRRMTTRQALRERLQNTLQQADNRLQQTVNRLVGEAYRRSLIEIVRQNGGRVLADDHSGSVINLELELF